MSVTSSVSAAMDAVASKKEQLHKAFLELQSHSSVLVNFTVQWKELEDHLNDREKLIQKRLEELERKEKENEKKKNYVAEKSTGNPNKTSEKKSASEKSSGNLDKTSDKKSATEKTTGSPNKASEKTFAAEKSTGGPSKTLPALKESKKPRRQLKSLCEKMDSEGLIEFLVDSRSEFTAIRNEAPAALRYAADPAKLVLQTLEGVYLGGNRKPFMLSAHRLACDLLLDALPFVLSPDELSSEAKKDAQKIAAVWKSKINVNVESQMAIVAFLQLLASYGISKEFKDDDLFALLLRISRHPKAPELCRALQFSHKIPDIVEKLSSDRKQLHAVQFICAFGLANEFPPVPLLKAYLEDEKKVSQELATRGRNPVAAKNNAVSHEINSLKTVIKFIEEHKLASQMSPKVLQERVNELQKGKAERRRSAEPIKSPTKRARLSSGDGVVSGADVGSGAGTVLPKPSLPSASALSNSSALLPEPIPPSAFPHSNPSDLYRPAPVASIPSYSLGGQGVYDMGSQGIYRSAYDVRSNPSSLSKSHLYSSDSLQSSAYDVGSNPSSLSRSHLYPSDSLQSSAYDVGRNPSSLSRSHLYPSDSLQQSSYDVGSNPSSLSRSHLYPSDSLQSFLYGVGSFPRSTDYGSYNNGSGVPPATSYQSSYLH